MRSAVLRSKGLGVLESVLQWFGYGLCHQLPERSFFGGGVQAPVCARDTGIYLGFVVSFCLITLLHRNERPRDFPRGYVWAVMGVFVALMGWDGVSSYGGFRTTTNELRLITGLGVGFSAAVLIVAMLNDELWQRSTVQRVLDPVRRFALWLVAIPVSYVVILYVLPHLGVGYPVMIALSVLFTLTCINLVIVAMFPAFDRRASRIVEVMTPAAIALALSFAEVALAAQLRTILLVAASRFGG